MAKTGPGKYELSGTVGELLHRMSQDGPDDEAGDVSESGRWYGLIRGPFKMGELKKSYPEEFSGLDKDDRKSLRSAAGAIVTEDGQGFVDVELYETVGAMKAAWQKVQEE